MIGYYQDKYPRGYVAMRGWDPQNPTKQTIALPVALETDEVTDAERPEWIWPGHVMFATADGTWTKTAPTEAEDKSRLCIAVAQDASTDWNVLSANSLVGLACSDGFKIATPFFKRGVKYNVGTPLTFCTAADVAAAGDPAKEGKPLHGWIKPATAASDVIIGYVAAVGSADDGSVNLQPNFVDAQNSMSPKETAFFVIWNTHFSPAFRA